MGKGRQRRQEKTGGCGDHVLKALACGQVGGTHIQSKREIFNPRLLLRLTSAMSASTFAVIVSASCISSSDNVRITDQSGATERFSVRG